MRRTELRRRTPLVARRSLERKASASGRRVRSTGPVRGVVDLVLERAQHSCELCLVALGPVRGVDHHVHHRRPRRAGGSRAEDTNTAANLLLLCPSCHEVVEVQRAAAYEGGWLLHAEQDPVVVPVLIGAQRLVRLTVDGRYAADGPS